MTGGFLGFPFAPIGIEHRTSVGEILVRHPQPLSDYTFSSLVAWAEVFGYEHAVTADGTLLVRQLSPAEQSPTLLQPIGPFPEELQERILRAARELPAPLRIESVSEEFLRRHPAFADRFDVAASRDRTNYVYAASALAELRGRRYARKRNLIAQATRLYPWTAEPLAPEHLAECRDIDVDIAAERTADAAITWEQESRALARAFDLYVPLGLRGVVVRVGGRVSAFAIYDRLGPATAVVHFERALRERTGLFQVIVRETSRVIASHGLAWINREEDLGDPGLRQAKRSYYPERLESKHTLTWRG